MHANRFPENAVRGAVALAALVAATGARADFVWNGAVDDLFTTNGNWLGGTAPPIGAVNDLITFGAEGLGNFTVTGADNAYTGITALNFTGADGAYAIGGTGSFAFSSGASLINDSTLTQTINVDLLATGAGLTVSAMNGSLNLGGGVDLSAGGGTQLNVAGNADTTISGVISGAGGALVKTGGGILSLTASNTFDGGTSLTAGTILLGHDQALGTGNLQVTGNATILSDNDSRVVGNAIAVDFVLTVGGGSDLGLSGVVSGAGVLAKSGTGTLTLSGANTLTGATRVNEGLLRLAGGSAISDTGTLVLSDVAGAEAELQASETVGSLFGGGTAGGTVNLNGNTLTIAGGQVSSYAGSIRGTGGLVVSGSGGILLSGGNVFSGGTVISGAGGQFGIGSDKALGTGGLAINADVTIMPFAGSRSIANAVTIGTTAFTIGGTDRIDFTGTVDLSGLTTTLTLDNTAGAEFSGVISNGGLTKAGTGVLTLSGSHTYTGDTTVNAGTLLLTGSLASDVFVNAGGVFTGTGAAQGLTNRSGGVVAPGSGIGTLTVNGDYDQQAGSTLQVDVDANNGASDRLTVTGTATLASGSTVSVSIASPDFIMAGDRFPIIMADGGVFDNGATIQSQSLTLGFVLAAAVDFTNGDVLYSIQAVRAPGAFADAADPGNNRAIGQALDSLVPVANVDPNGGAAELLGQLDMLDASQLNEAISELSPERYNTVTAIQIETVTQFLSTQGQYLNDRRHGVDTVATARALRSGALASAETDPRVLAEAIAAQDEAFAVDPHAGRIFGAWVRGTGAVSSLEPDKNRTGFNAQSYGAEAGVDFFAEDDVVAGLALGYVTSDVNLDGNAGDVDVDTFRIGPYATWFDKNTFLDASLTAGVSTYDVRRNIPLLNRKASADYDGYDITGTVGGGVEWTIDNSWSVSPSFSLQYSYFTTESFTERGAAGANLRLDDRDTDSFRSRLSLSVIYAPARRGRVEAHVGWQQEYLDNDDVRASFAGGGNRFRVDTGDREDTFVVLGGGISTPISARGLAYLRYEGAFSGDSDVHTFAAGLSLEF